MNKLDRTFEVSPSGENGLMGNFLGCKIFQWRTFQGKKAFRKELKFVG